MPVGAARRYQTGQAVTGAGRKHHRDEPGGSSGEVWPVTPRVPPPGPYAREVLPIVAKNGGVIMVNFYSAFIVPTEQLKKDKEACGTLHDVVDHIDHLVKVAGIDHVGIGSDFDGVPRLPEQLESVATYPLITQELLNRGYDRESIHKILGGNVLRVLREAEGVAKAIASTAAQQVDVRPKSK